ncbi:hypothetical protein AHFPHNDE_01129 [Pseudomonas sp. MM227]|uniref:hypothetical protein n=1 Tax=Pseudomonas sp. MM227 TaxID=3019968 RepID=UPI00221E6195|nr:hypothetical protein [Pseudomonas sp. MM227]CAI3787465.1 hypothetical protein AHFPHNDE_01129 [Pseudomonas sp. MM227]
MRKLISTVKRLRREAIADDPRPGLWVHAGDYNALAAQRDEGWAREAELQKDVARMTSAYQAERARRTEGRARNDALQQRLAEAKALMQESLPALEQGATAFKSIRPVRAKVRDYLASPSCAQCRGSRKILISTVCGFTHKTCTSCADGEQQS